MVPKHIWYLRKVPIQRVWGIFFIGVWVYLVKTANFSENTEKLILPFILNYISGP